eukprot:TRINITY_DN15567_c0_g1_i4.p1 TRINITY_DN15567_c0_g1~~TRINITY_DN15567_c0_g1_i4.p1  ORF type:complete len:256 (+),score=-30.22 TRINITY_DN15567_c0_g1_i4:197-964(+)
MIHNVSCVRSLYVKTFEHINKSTLYDINTHLIGKHYLNKENLTNMNSIFYLALPILKYFQQQYQFETFLHKKPIPYIQSKLRNNTLPYIQTQLHVQNFAQTQQQQDTNSKSQTLPIPNPHKKNKPPQILHILKKTITRNYVMLYTGIEITAFAYHTQPNNNHIDNLSVFCNDNSIKTKQKGNFANLVRYNTTQYFNNKLILIILHSYKLKKHSTVSLDVCNYQQYNYVFSYDILIQMCTIALIINAIVHITKLKT